MIRTCRLILREWRDADLAPWIAMGLDPASGYVKLQPRTPDESTAWISRMRDHFASRGFGFWAVELPERAPFIGQVGLLTLTPDQPGFPGVEIGWDLACAHWGNGFATEAASAVLAHGFDQLRLPEIVATAAACNTPSRRVMEKIGMGRVPDRDFRHPDLPPNHRLARRVLYRMSRLTFENTTNGNRPCSMPG